MRKVFTFLFLFFSYTTVFGAHLDLFPIGGVYSNQYSSDGSYFSSNQKRYVMDSKTVYCVEPGAPILSREYLEESNLSLSNIDNNTLNKLRLIGYYGYDYPGHNNNFYFIASQELIWEELGEDVHFTSLINNNGNVINIDSYKQEIMDLVYKDYIVPSFESSYKGEYGTTLVLSDANEILSEFYVDSDIAYIQDNNLFINFDFVGSRDITFHKKRYDDLSSFFYNSDSSQDFMFLRPLDVSFTITVESFIPSNKLVINKTGLVVNSFDDSFNFVSDNLDHVKFSLYAKNDIYNGDLLLYKKDELVGNYETGVTDNLILPNGSYLLREDETNNEFLLMDDLEFTLNNHDMEVSEFMVNLENERKKVLINLHKQGEVFDRIDNNSCSFSSEDLSGVKFGLFNSSPIYSKDKLILKKNSLINIFETDSNGVINEVLDIPNGSYYLKELETIDGYLIDSSIYEFSVSSDINEDIHIFVTKEPLLNEIIKSDLVIHKVDLYGNKLKGATFRIFDDDYNIIYEGVTDIDGSITLHDLGYGKYHICEVSAPDGYYLNDMVYDFVVTDNNEVIELTIPNKMMPITSDIDKEPLILSTIGLGFGVVTLSFMVIYDKKNKTN